MSEGTKIQIWQTNHEGARTRHELEVPHPLQVTSVASGDHLLQRIDLNDHGVSARLFERAPRGRPPSRPEAPRAPPCRILVSGAVRVASCYRLVRPSLRGGEEPGRTRVS